MAALRLIGLEARVCEGLVKAGGTRGAMASSRLDVRRFAPYRQAIAKIKNQYPPRQAFKIVTWCDHAQRSARIGETSVDHAHYQQSSQICLC
jgi:hypothetical protein